MGNELGSFAYQSAAPCNFQRCGRVGRAH